MSDKLKIVFIGNSIINGFPYDRNQEFVSLYRDKSGNDVMNRGINGDTVHGVIRRFAQDVLACKPDIVVIMTGTNEFIYKESLPEQCMKDIVNLVELAQSHGIEPILLTPLSVDPQMAKSRWMVCDDVDYEVVQEQIMELKKLINNCGQENHVKVIDLNFAFSEYVALVGEQTAYYDGIHPTREGHKFLAEVVGRFL
ncbi:MAG: GDSL-type esterase/lipase family protein [Aminipila sp.]